MAALHTPQACSALIPACSPDHGLGDSSVAGFRGKDALYVSSKQVRSEASRLHSYLDTDLGYKHFHVYTSLHMCAGRYTCMYMCVWRILPILGYFICGPLLCTCIYIHIFTCIPVHICVQTGTQTCICVSEGSSLVILFVAFFMCMYVHIFMYIPVHICMWVHKHVYVCVWRLEDNLRCHPPESHPPPFRLGLWMAWHSPVRSER